MNTAYGLPSALFGEAIYTLYKELIKEQGANIRRKGNLRYVGLL